MIFLWNIVSYIKQALFHTVDKITLFPARFFRPSKCGEIWLGAIMFQNVFYVMKCSTTPTLLFLCIFSPIRAVIKASLNFSVLVSEFLAFGNNKQALGINISKTCRNVFLGHVIVCFAKQNYDSTWSDLSMPDMHYSREKTKDYCVVRDALRGKSV